ncbi:MAG: HDOD domain-containing protein [Gammaproteobacteria bacterium]|jgi:HD-like signal output (HDOD) protein
MKSVEPSIPGIETLRRIETIGGLSEGHLILLGKQLQLRHAKPGEILLELDSTENSSLYIVEGKIEMRSHDGSVRSKRVGADDELAPIAQLRPSIYRIKAAGPVLYMKIDRQTLIDYAALAESDVEDISVHTLFGDDDEEDNSVVNHLYRNLMNNSIRLPSLPSVAERFLRVYRGDATDIDALEHVLTAYPDVTRKLCNIARCAKRDDLSPLQKIGFVVDRLGWLAVYCVVMSYSVGKLVNRLPPEHMHRVRSFWEHSINIAAISRILARPRKAFPPDLAMLAGLVHGIGVLIIDDRLLEHHHLKLDHLEIDHAIQVMRPEISSLLLRKWDLDDELIRVAEECGDWSRDHAGPADLCDLVLAANYYALLHSDVDHVLPRADAVPAIARLDVSPAESIAAIREAPAVGRNIQKLFR